MDNNELLTKIRDMIEKESDSEVFGGVEVGNYPEIILPMSLYEALVVIRDGYGFSQAEKDQLIRFRDNLINSIPVDFVEQHPLFQILQPLMMNAVSTIVSLEIILGEDPDFIVTAGSSWRFLGQVMGNQDVNE